MGRRPACGDPISLVRGRSEHESNPKSTQLGVELTKCKRYTNFENLAKAPNKSLIDEWIIWCLLFVKEE